MVKRPPQQGARQERRRNALLVMNGDVEMGSREQQMLEEKEKLLLKVRTKEGSEIDFVLQKSGIVNDLKQAIIERLQLVDKNVRLIFGGKLLDPPNASLNSFKLDNGSFVHAVITNRSSHSQSQEGGDTGRAPAATRIDMSNLRGLDTLMLPRAHRSPLSIDEVASLRSYFHEDIVEHARDEVDRERDETDVDYNYRCESEWMAAQGPNSEFRLNLYGRSLFSLNPALLSANSVTDSAGGGSGARALRLAYVHEASGTPTPEMGTYREFFYGFLMGFALGFMMVFCLWDSNVSHRQKMGILCGLLVQMMFTFMQQGTTGTAVAGTQHTSTSSTTLDVPVIDGSGK